MGLFVSTSNSFENREQLRSTAREILIRGGVKEEVVSKITDTGIFDKTISSANPQLSIIKASTQISLNQSLNETLKYLRAHSKKEAKKPVFGELWNIVKTTNENSEQNPYHGELYEFHIDMEKNIFAA